MTFILLQVFPKARNSIGILPSCGQIFSNNLLLQCQFMSFLEEIVLESLNDSHLMGHGLKRQENIKCLHSSPRKLDLLV